MPVVDAFLTKPCSSRKLLETIARFCLLLICLSVLRAATVKVSHDRSEVVAELDLHAPGTDWGQEGKEAALATVFVDGRAQQQIMLYAGSGQFAYTVFLGALAAGEHDVDVRGSGVEFSGARFHDDSSGVMANAPVLYARANTIGKFTDIPLIVYCERLSEHGLSFLQYTVIFSNEDGGTSTRALMARWGRTTDVEYVYRAFPGRATIQAKDHKEVEFHGRRDGTHPLLMPITDNNMIGEADASIPIRYQIAPILVDLTGHSREEVIDQHPIAYEVMAKELQREGKLRPFGAVDGEKVSDPLNYLYFEMKLAKRESFVATLVHLKGDPRWYSSHLGHTDFAIRTWTRGAAESAGGFVRTTVELPPGTKPDQISEIGFECIVGEKACVRFACRVEGRYQVLLSGQRLPAGFERLDSVGAARNRGRPNMDIRVKVTPKSSKTELTGYLPDGTWKVKVAAAPEKGKANHALCEFLAEQLGVAKSRVRIVSGETSHLKRIHVED